MISKKLFPIIIFIYFFPYANERNLNYFNFQKVSKKNVLMHRPPIKKSLANAHFEVCLRNDSNSVRIGNKHYLKIERTQSVVGTFPFIIAQLVIIVKTNSVHNATGASSSSFKSGADSIIEVHFGCNANEHFIEHLHLAEC